jgi:hypothetical protein
MDNICYEESNFFLSLLGEEYGYNASPKYIYVKTLALVEQRLERQKKFNEHGKKYFGFDNSNDPDGRRLISSTRKLVYHRICWIKITGQLLLMNHSTTEWESFYALSLDRFNCN